MACNRITRVHHLMIVVNFAACPRSLCSLSTILPALTSPFQWEQDGDTRARTSDPVLSPLIPLVLG